MTPEEIAALLKEGKTLRLLQPHELYRMERQRIVDLALEMYRKAGYEVTPIAGCQGAYGIRRPGTNERAEPTKGA